MRFPEVPSSVSIQDCDFYHSIDIPNAPPINGAWDLRGKFDEYIGGVDVRGRSVLDLGTATGFLAFETEKRGARSVVAHELESLLSFDRVPFANGPGWDNKAEWAAREAKGLDRQKAGFWFVRRALNSKVQAMYGSIPDLLSFSGRFDIVIAGALMEHLADPVTAVGAACRLATKTVVVGFTPVHDSDDEFMKPLIEWSDPNSNYVWWAASRGLYRRVLNNMGFDMAVKPCNIERGGALVQRSTIVAERRG